MGPKYKINALAASTCEHQPRSPARSKSAPVKKITEFGEALNEVFEGIKATKWENSEAYAPKTACQDPVAIQNALILEHILTLLVNVQPGTITKSTIHNLGSIQSILKNIGRRIAGYKESLEVVGFTEKQKAVIFMLFKTGSTTLKEKEWPKLWAYNPAKLALVNKLTPFKDPKNDPFCAKKQ